MSPSRCPKCGAALTVHKPAGLCPACVLAELTGHEPNGNADRVDPLNAVDNSKAPDWRLEPGDRFGAYRIDRLIGRGGMGEVYEAEELEQHRRVALKVLHHRLRRPDDRARFLAEGQLAAAVNHPNSVYVYETKEIAGIPVIAMELLPGRTLKDRVRSEGPLPAAQAVDAILQVIEGLDAVHATGVLHRDVKPSNCFIDHDSTIKVGDFGLSISIVSSEDAIRSLRPAFEGTPEFAAPEQIAGGPLDVRADIYSVGATLYFLLSGHPPFEHQDLDGLIASIRHDSVHFSKDLRSRISRGLAGLVTRCLAKDPAERLGSYAALKKELAPFCSAATAPAPVGLRIAATAFDLIVLLPVVAIVLGNLFGSRVIYHPVEATLVVVSLLVLYWGILEGVFGAAYGKRRCGLKVVTWQGDAPGVGRALARSALIVAPIATSVEFTRLARFAAAPWSLAVLPVGLLGLATIVVIVLARQRTGSVSVHDLVTGTRVSKHCVVHEEARPKSPSPSVPSTNGDRIGPYDVMSVVGTTDRGRILSGWDSRLKRSVWIHVLPTGAAPVNSTIRNASRPSRLHWLQGQRTESGAWDAYESLDGQPLIASTIVQSWSSVSTWLCDLARELSVGLSEDSIEVLALDRIWITSDGRGKLLDFRAPDLAGGEGPVETFETISAQQFLYAAAQHALGSPALPPRLAVSEFLRNLKGGGFGSVSEIAARLTELQVIPDLVTADNRGMTLGLGVVVYLLASDALGRIFVDGVFQHLPSSAFARLSLTERGTGLIACAMLALIWAFAFRSGSILRAFGIAVVTQDGIEASRGRAVYRAALAWSWVPAQLAAIAFGWPVAGIAILKVGGLFYAADHPSRGLQDRIAGTYLVPR